MTTNGNYHMTLELRKLDNTFLNLPPQGLKAAVLGVVNELVDTVNKQNAVIDVLNNQILELKVDARIIPDKPISAARAKRSK